MVTIYHISSKFGGGYWTTDKSMVDEDVRVDVEENDGIMGFVVTSEEVSEDEFARRESAAEGRDFPGW